VSAQYGGHSVIRILRLPGQFWVDYSPVIPVVFIFLLAQQPTLGRASSFMGFLDHTQRHTTVGRITYTTVFPRWSKFLGNMDEPSTHRVCMTEGLMFSCYTAVHTNICMKHVVSFMFQNFNACHDHKPLCKM